MGVDASIFAVKAKRYYYFDRLYNVDVFELTWGNGGDARYEDAMFNLTNRKSCEYESTVYAIKKNIEYWKTQPEENAHRVGWNQQVLKFVELFPGDTFFIATDHEGPSYHEIVEKEGYDQYLFPEDIPEPPTCHCPKAWCPLHLTESELEEQREAVESLQKALSVGGTLIIENGYLELANLDGNPRKVKV